jgi:hypothetical protein
MAYPDVGSGTRVPLQTENTKMRSLFIRSLSVAIVAVLMASAAAESAQAQDCGYGGYGHGGHGRGVSLYIGSGGYGFNYANYGSLPYYNYNTYRPSYSIGPVWHDTSHFEHHGLTVVPHSNHHHVIPGHYDYHRTGHWHR